ncbi:MAG: membrane assembly protein AsmA [Bacteroidia bacterium]|nr:membrane assembly protein AsmA [Bacteroidia bacterium]
MKKFIKIFAIVFVVLLAALIALPFLFKDKIVNAIKIAANENLNAKVSFNNDISLSLIKGFPNLSLGIDELCVANLAPFEGDTLAYLKNFSATVDLMSVLKGDQIKIKKIFLDEAKVHVIVLKDGKANYDITKPSADSAQTTGEESKFSIALTKYELRNSVVIYDDRSLDFLMNLTGLNHQGEGDFTQDLFVLKTITDVKETNLVYGGIKYLHKVNAGIKADLDMDMKKFKFTFKENEARLNELYLGLDGWLAMPADDIDMDLKFNAKKTDFKNILSLVPAVYAKDFDAVKTSGKLALDGMVKGTYNDKKIPAFTLNLLVENGMFKYPSLPVAVNNMKVKLKVSNPDGVDDHTIVDLSEFHVELGQEPFDATLLMKTPVSDPYLKTAMQGRVNLDNVVKLIPLEEGMKLGGEIIADFAADGHIKSIEKGAYDKFNASGRISASRINYSSKDLPQTFLLNSATLTFNPRNVSLTGFDSKIGKTDMRADGTIDNIFGYVLRNETIKGVFNFNSNLIDANEFLTEEPAQPAVADTMPLQAFQIPANIDFTLQSRVGKLLYDNLELGNVHGVVKVINQQLIMNDVGMNIFNGSVEMSGLYDSKNIQKPLMDMSFGLKNVDIQKMVNSFETVQKMAPVAKNAQGNISADFKMKTMLNSDLTPVVNSINASGKLSIPQATVKDYQPMVKVAEILKMPQYKEVKVNNVNIQFEVKDGRIYVNPFDIKSGNINMNVNGSSGFDQSIDYKISAKFPRSEMGSAANEVLGNLSSKLGSKGINLSMADIINLDILMGGTVPSPVIKTSFKDLAKGAGETVKDELNKRKEEEIAKAKAEAERLKQEALTNANKAKAEAEAKAKAEADRIKAEAEQKKKEAEAAAKKKADEELKKRLKGKLKL